MLELDKRTIAKRLEEAPELSGILWRAYWGVAKEDSEYPSNIDKISDAINQAQSCITTLVHGDFGTGKTSFMRLLEKKLMEHGNGKKNSDDQKSGEQNHENAQDKDSSDQQEAEGFDFHTLWLHMPALTNHVNSSVVAVVVSAIVNELQRLSGYNKNSKLQDTSNKDFANDLAKLKGQVADLWRIEGPAREPKQSGSCTEMPQPNRMVGSTQDVSERYRAANIIEEDIEVVLSKFSIKLVIFLDDLDRCPLSDAGDLIRLLLRFSGTHGMIHFVIASNREVLEHGVEEWMQEYGMKRNNTPLVTANSALRKYIDFEVRLPGFSDQVSGNYVDSWLSKIEKMDAISNESLFNGFNLVQKGKKQSMTILDVYFNWLTTGLE